MEEPEQRARRTAALAACDRVLSHGAALSMRDRLTALAGLGYDLDALPDVYGDGIVAELEQKTAGLLGKPSAAFFPTGTMAQQVGLRLWAARTGNQVVALHPLAHPEQHEDSALSALTRLRTVHLTAAARPPSAAEVRDTAELFGTLMLELPLREGRLYPALLGRTERCGAGGPGSRRRGALRRGAPVGVPDALRPDPRADRRAR